MDWEVPLALHCNVCSSLSIQKEPIYDSYKCVCNPHWINELCVACAECNAFTVFVGVWRHLLVRRWCNVDHFWFRGIHVAFNLKMIIHQCIQQFECALVSVKSVIKLTHNWKCQERKELVACGIVPAWGASLEAENVSSSFSRVDTIPAVIEAETSAGSCDWPVVMIIHQWW